MTSNSPLWVAGLTRTYGRLKAVDGVTFEVAEGEIFGLLGPNGAGKTTIIEILEGLRTRTSGDVRVLGLDPEKNSRVLRSRIGVCLQDTSLADRASVSEIARLVASCYPSHVDLTTLLKQMDLWQKRDTWFGALSGGQKQRLAVALALINNPQLIFLDEPSAGLDAKARREMHQIIERLRREKRTILLTTHQIEEADLLCDRVAIIDRGHLAAIGTPSELRLSMGSSCSSVVVECLPRPTSADLSLLPGSSLAETHTGGVTLTIPASDATRTIADVVQWAKERGYTLSDIEIQRQTLEDVFLKVTTRTDSHEHVH